MKYFINDNLTASAQQVAFLISRPFCDSMIDVYKNSVMMIPEKDYKTQSDTGRILMNEPCKAGDVISIRSVPQIDSLSIEVVSKSNKDKPNSIFSRWGTVEKLKYNNEYKIHLRLKKNPYEFTFLSMMNPMLTTIRKVNEDIGEFIDGYSDKYLTSMIHRNSLELIDLIDELTEADSGYSNITYIKNADGAYTFSNKYGEKWVRYKTEISLILAKYYGISREYGSVSKSLGDISIEVSKKLPYIDQLLKRLEGLYDSADDAIRGLNYTRAFVKASTNYQFTERTIRF